jgi:hypothetical protein
VLSLYLRELAEREAPDISAAFELSSRPPGLDGYRDHWWEDQERLWGAEFAAQHEEVRFTFDLLACALGPLRYADLAALGRLADRLDGDSLEFALWRLERFVADELSARSYAIAHPLLADHRVRQLTDSSALADRDALFVRWGQEARKEAERESDWSLLPVYVVRHLGELLARSRAGPDALLELASGDWSEAWDARTDELNGHLGDVAWAQAAARSAKWCGGALVPHRAR